MKKTKIGLIISLSLFSLIIFVGGLLLLGLNINKTQTENSMQAQIEEHEKCDCDHCHDGCGHNDCDHCYECEDSIAKPLLASGTYYVNNSSFYKNQVSHYRCTNSSHSGDNDFTTSSSSGTCYSTDRYVYYSDWTWQYEPHSCSASAWDSHNWERIYRNHSTRYVVCSDCGGTGGYATGQHIQGYTVWRGCTSCGGSGAGLKDGNTWADMNTYSAGRGGYYKCSLCGQTGYPNFSGTCYDYDTGNYRCTYCGTSTTNISLESSNCPSRVTQYKCSYCKQTFSYNSTDSCSSRSWKRCDHCGGNYSTCSCGYYTTDYYSHSLTFNYYSYTNIDTNATTTSSTAFSVATGFTVKFNKNASAGDGSAVSGTMANQYMLHNHSEALTSNSYSRQGYVFGGWATTSGGTSPTYSNGQVISLTTSNVTSGGTLNLYAVWLSPVAKPYATSGTSFEYDPGGTTFGVGNYNNATMIQSGTVQETNRGNYSVTYTLRAGFCWAGSSYSTSPVVLEWSIIVRTVTIPTVSGSYTFDNQPHQATITNTSAYYTQTGTNSATNAQTYTVYFDLLNTSDYKWSDNTVAQKSGTWTIAKATLTIPTRNENPRYTGSSVSPTLNNFNDSLMTKSNETSAVNVKTNGNYTLVVSLTNAAKVNYMWTDGTQSAINIDWNVLPINISGATVTIGQSSFVYDGTAKTPTEEVSI